MTPSLPPDPSLENLKKQAKTLQKAWRAGAAAAVARIRAAHPQYSAFSDKELRAAKPRLTDCQLVIAREAGFDSWPQLVAVEAANKESADPFLELACLCYDDPHFDHRSFHARAHQMLRDKPQLLEANIWCAAAAGNTGALRRFLDEEPTLVNRGGPHGWAPLICACYSRVRPVDPAHSTLDAAKLLLERGADPNAYTMKGNADARLGQTQRRFTALTGLFGGGSTGLANQPPHPHWRELAELLLTHGANPADEMALSINQDACLEMLLRHGLKPDAMASSGISLMGRALSQAARHGNVEHARLLLAHHARADEKFNGKLPWEHAMRLGRVEVARLLEQAGAPTGELDEVGRFVSLCMAGDARGARDMLQQAPDLVARAPKDMVQRAVWTQQKNAVELVLDLGFDPNHQEDNAAIHSAAGEGDEGMVRLLLRRGASVTLRDPWYDGTAVEWAEFYARTEMRDMLLNEAPVCLFDALDHDRLDRVPEILERDPAALERPFAECLSRTPKPEDWQTPLVRMVIRGKKAAVELLLDHGADSGARHPDGRSLIQAALDQGLDEIAALLQEGGAPGGG